MRGPWISAGAGVESLQISCMMQWNVLAAEVKDDGMVGTVATLGTDIFGIQKVAVTGLMTRGWNSCDIWDKGPEPLIILTTGYVALRDQIAMDSLVLV